VLVGIGVPFSPLEAKVLLRIGIPFKPLEVGFGCEKSEMMKQVVEHFPYFKHSA